MARLKSFQLAPDIFANLFTIGAHSAYTVDANGFPDGVVVDSFAEVRDASGNLVGVKVLLEHQTFPDIDPTGTVPIVIPGISKATA